MHRSSRSHVLALVLFAAAVPSVRAESAPAANRAPTVVTAVEPVRPRPLMNFGASGTVEVSFTITAHGTVENATIHRSNDPVLEGPVLNAIKQWKFKPAVKNGQVVAVRARQSFNFEDPHATPHTPRDLPSTPAQPKNMVATAK
jgi:protein TonB